jgi:hypothetical protein
VLNRARLGVAGCLSALEQARIEAIRNEAARGRRGSRVRNGGSPRGRIGSMANRPYKTPATGGGLWCVASRAPWAVSGCPACCGGTRGRAGIVVARRAASCSAVGTLVEPRGKCEGDALFGIMARPKARFMPNHAGCTGGRHGPLHRRIFGPAGPQRRAFGRPGPAGPRTDIYSVDRALTRMSFLIQCTLWYKNRNRRRSTAPPGRPPLGQGPPWKLTRRRPARQRTGQTLRQ